jgi:HAD superfamily hydrolase (TIGR01509 family)
MTGPAGSAIVGGVTIRAVAFDLGGVLEDVAPAEQFLAQWQRRLDLSEEQLRRLRWPLTRNDPGDQVKTGAVTEEQYRELCLSALGLAGAAADEFMAVQWDWYSGELDVELAEYATALRPRYRTGILSNSMAGARRAEQARFGFAELVDVIVYSDEIGLAKPDPRAYSVLCAELGIGPAELVFLDNRPPNVEAACQLGIHGLLHVSTPASIAAVELLISGPR